MPLKAEWAFERGRPEAVQYRERRSIGMHGRGLSVEVDDALGNLHKSRVQDLTNWAHEMGVRRVPIGQLRSASFGYSHDQITSALAITGVWSALCAEPSDNSGRKILTRT